MGLMASLGERGARRGWRFWDSESCGKAGGFSFFRPNITTLFWCLPVIPAVRHPSGDYGEKP